MRIAIPVAEGQLASHFGHCEKFALIDLDPEARRVTARTEAGAPEHQPGLLPRWLKEQGVSLVIAGGMGERAQAHFAAASIEVITGVEGGTPDSLVEDYLAGRLVSRPVRCQHGCH
jgi:predicted Fe-Mo cluster-binding NifX family protein